MKEQLAEINKLVTSSEFFGLESNDSVLIKVILKGYEQEVHLGGAKVLIINVMKRIKKDVETEIKLQKLNQNKRNVV